MIIIEMENNGTSFDMEINSKNTLIHYEQADGMGCLIENADKALVKRFVERVSELFNEMVLPEIEGSLEPA